MDDRDFILSQMAEKLSVRDKIANNRSPESIQESLLILISGSVQISGNHDMGTGVIKLTRMMSIDEEFRSALNKLSEKILGFFPNG